MSRRASLTEAGDLRASIRPLGVVTSRSIMRTAPPALQAARSPRAHPWRTRLQRLWVALRKQWILYEGETWP